MNEKFLLLIPLLFLPIIASASSVQATVGLEEGNLSVSISPISPFSTITLNGTEQSATTSFTGPITVVDSTGSGNGWHIMTSASPFRELAPNDGFASGTTALSLPDNSLIVEPPDKTTINGSSPVNPVQNSSFEQYTGNVATDWIAYQNVSTATDSISTMNAYLGNVSQEIQVSGTGGRAGINQNISVTPGSWYELHGYLDIPSLTNGEV